MNPLFQAIQKTLTSERQLSPAQIMKTSMMDHHQKINDDAYLVFLTLDSIHKRSCSEFVDVKSIEIEDIPKSAIHLLHTNEYELRCTPSDKYYLLFYDVDLCFKLQTA